jgi:hypothetical protein
MEFGIAEPATVSESAAISLCEKICKPIAHSAAPTT